MNTKISN